MSDPRTRLRLRVAPGAARSAVVGRYGEGWKVRVAAPPVDGRANGALTGYLAGVLGLEASALRVVSGAAGRDKVVEVTGRDAGQTDALLTAAAGQGGAS